MHAITNPTALELSSEIKKAVAPDGFINEVLDRKDEMEQLKNYLKRREEKIKVKNMNIGMEKMIITAIQNGFPEEAIQTLCKRAEITETRLVELRAYAQ